MNKELIIQIAREAGLFVHKEVQPEIERFFQLATEWEREQIHDEWSMCVQSDLENGVKSLNERAAMTWQNQYPEISKFGEWLRARGEAK